MSWMRINHVLTYFKEGVSESYVFPCNVNDVEDYEDTYEDNKSFCELIGTFVNDATNNEAYAWKIVQILAKKLKIDNELRDRPLTTEEYLKLDMKHFEKLEKDTIGDTNE